MHVNTELVFDYQSFSFNNFVDSPAQEEGSSVHHIIRYQFWYSLDSCRKASKILSGYLSIQSILMQPLLDNMEDVFDRVQIRTSCRNGKFSSVDSAFHPSKVDKVSARNFWGLSGNN